MMKRKKHIRSIFVYRIMVVLLFTNIGLRPTFAQIEEGLKDNKNEMLEDEQEKETIPSFQTLANPYSYANYNIVNLKEKGVILFQLKTRKKSIEAYRKEGFVNIANKIKKEQAKENKHIANVFGTNIDFCPVYFFYSEDTEQLKTGVSGFLMNKDLEVDETLTVPEFYIILEKGAVKQVNNPLGTFKETDKNYHENSNLISSAFVFKDKDGNQLTKPFPYYVKAFRQKRYADNAKKINSGLHKFYLGN